jgi:hypothetical protein
MKPTAARSRRRAASWFGVDLGHGTGRLPPRGSSRRVPEVQVDLAALELGLVDLAFAVVLAPGLERE